MRRTFMTFAAAALLSAPPVLAGQGHGGSPKPTTRPTTAHPQTASTSHGSPVHAATSHGNASHGPTTHTQPAQGSHGAHGSSAKPKPAKTSPPNTSPKSSPKGSGSKGSKKTTTSGSTTTGTGTTTPLTPVQQKLQANTKLASKLQGRLPDGTDVMAASSGFRNLGQFVAAVNVSNNLGIPFAKLKTSMVDDKLSLGQSIQALKPTANSTLEASRAEHDADVEIRATVTTTSTTTTTTAPTTKKSKKTAGSQE